jgi:soluble calcium-activated nucleotidase 1
VADSKKPSFYSILIDGVLMKDPATGTFSVQWGAEHKLISAHNEAGRGMELSELVKYNGCVWA